MNLLNQSQDIGKVLKSLSNRLYDLVVPLENWKDLFLYLEKKESQHPLFVSYSTAVSPRATGGRSPVFARFEHSNAKHRKLLDRPFQVYNRSTDATRIKTTLGMIYVLLLQVVANSENLWKLTYRL